MSLLEQTPQKVHEPSQEKAREVWEKKDLCNKV